MLTAEVNISADKGRAAKSSENTACLRRLTRDCLTERCPNPGCIGAVIGKLACQRSDKVTIAIESQHLEACQATFAETRPVAPDRALLRIAHRSLRNISSNISRNLGIRKIAREICELPAEAVAISRKLLKLPTEDLLRRMGQEEHLFGERIHAPSVSAAVRSFMQRSKRK
jgi:hypothetical protein